jgi:hypothetical protein
MIYKLATLAAVGLIASCVTGFAQDSLKPTTDLIDDPVLEKIHDFLDAPIVWKSIVARNKQTADLTAEEIDALDKQWRAEREVDEQPIVASVLTSPLSSYLTRVQAGNLGLFSEIFVMDSVGLNVGQSATTSDYWQGDEAKFQKTFPVGPDAVFIDEAEFNEDTGTWRAQVNLTLTDTDGKSIGAATVEINLTELQRRKLLGLNS